MSSSSGRVFVRGIRTVFRYARRQPLIFVVSLVGATAYALMSVASAIVLGRVTDEAIAPAFSGGVTRATLVGAAVALVAVGVLRGGSIILRRYFAALTTFRTQADLRRQVTDRFLDVPLAYHRARPAGELLARADNDVLAATELMNALPFSLGVLVLLVVALGSLVLVDPVLALVALALFPALAVLNRIYTNLVHRPVAVVQQRVARVSSVVHESVDGALTVKTLGRAEAEVERLTDAAESLRSARLAVGRIRASFEPAIDALPNLGSIVLLGVGVWQISAGRLEVGGLVQAIALFALLATPMRVTGFFLQELPRAVVASERIDDVLREPVSAHPEPEHAIELPAGPIGISFEDVDYAFPGEHRVLRGLSFSVAPGEVVAIVGSTGAGKTTICELLVRADDPTSGSIKAAGVDLRDIARDQLRASVAIAFQEPFLFASTIRENVTMGAPISDAEVWEALRLACIDEFVASLGGSLDAVVGERGVTLSGGQRQRVALARALVRKPRVLALDDATSAIDPVVESRILEGLRSALDMTTILVAHRISTIELADRVVYLSGGRVEATGTHLELLALPGYAAIARAYERDGCR